MQVIGQHYEGTNLKRKTLPSCGDCIPQMGDMIDKQGPASVEEIDREKPASTRNKRSAIVGHAAQLSRCMCTFEASRRITLR